MTKLPHAILILATLLTGCGQDSEMEPRTSNAEGQATEPRISNAEQRVAALEARVLEMESDLDKMKRAVKSIAGEDISWLVGKFWKKTTGENAGGFREYLTVIDRAVITFDKSGTKATLGTVTYPIGLADGKTTIHLHDENGIPSGKLTLSRTDLSSIRVAWLPSRTRQAPSEATFVWVEKVTD